MTEIIAHRGLWTPHRDAQNQVGAVTDALKNGWSVEVDVQIQNGEALIGHGPYDAFYPLETLLTAIETAPGTGKVFWDVKSPDVGDYFKKTVFPRRKWLKQRSVFFDHELTGKKKLPGLPYLQRIDDEVKDPKDDPKAQGFWLAHRNAWGNLPDGRTYPGARSYACSPELFGEPLPLKLWNEWVAAGLAGICTDYPHFLSMILSGASPLEPDRPWW